MRSNPFQPLYAKCNSGDPADKYRDLADFPSIIDVELTSLCNFRCLMCPTGIGALKRPSGFMSREVFKAIVGECKEYGAAVRLIGWGEPLLHPDVARFVRMASDAGLLTHLNTNGSRLSRDTAASLMEAGLSSLKFSFQGVDRQGYQESRGRDFFDELLALAGTVKDIRGNKDLPYLHLSTTITDEKHEQVVKFLEQASAVVDGVTIGKTIFDFLDTSSMRLRPHEQTIFDRLVKSEGTKKKHPDPCPEVYEKLSIAWDGTGRVCCNDYQGKTNLGKVGEQTLAEMWLANEMEAYRTRLADKEYTGPLCSVCYDYQGLTEG